MNNLAQTIMKRTYAHGDESWDNIAYRVTKNVLRAVGIDMRQRHAQETCRLITERKFIPAGRYLYASGRPFHQVNNCALLDVHDSREGWSELLAKASMSLMTGAGIGVNYSSVRHEGAKIRRTGGTASGPISLIQIVNECGRGIIQGGSRRSAIWAGLNWAHPDIHKFIKIKNWSPEVCSLKEKDFSFPATLDLTNISVCLDDRFFEAYADDDHQQYALAHGVYWSTVEQMLKTGEPGFAVDIGKNAGETLRNAPLSADTHVLISTGYKQIRSIVDTPVTIWTGKHWSKNVIFKRTGVDVQTVRVKISGEREIKADPTHEFLIERWPGVIERRQASRLQKDDVLSVQLPVSPDHGLFDHYTYTLGFMFGDGTFHKNGSSAVTLCTEEKKALLPYFDVDSIRSKSENLRGYTLVYFKTDSFSGCSKDIYPKFSTEELSFWLAGLFDADGAYDETRQSIRLSAPSWFLHEVRRDLERLGILSTVIPSGKSGYTGKQCYLLCIMASSVSEFQRLVPTQRLHINANNYVPYRRSKLRVVSVEPGPVEDVFCCDVKYEEHSFVAEGVVVSNCCEVSSKEDSDICNLGTINLARVKDLEELKYIIDFAMAFLLAGSIYSDVPYPEVDKVRSKNRRLGLGLMGVHAWLLNRGKPYAPDEELGTWLAAYAKSGKYANKWADAWELSRPKKTRAIAPNGTTSIVAETTGGIEPIFCVAYKRRYLKGSQQCYQYVIDPVAKQLIDSGVVDIEDAYTLEPEKRVAFQAWIQGYVDHGISSTINLPAYGSEHNNAKTIRAFGSMLIRYLPQLRGITVYPDGSRSGQPLVPVSYEEALKHEGSELVEESMDVCSLKGGQCGD